MEPNLPLRKVEPQFGPTTQVPLDFFKGRIKNRIIFLYLEKINEISIMQNWPNKSHHKNTDLSFSYSVSSSQTVISNFTFENTQVGTLNGNLFNDNNIVGRYTILNTIYDINNNNNNNLYDVTAQSTFFLQKGNIQFMPSYKAPKNSQGTYLFPSGTYTYKIICGTGSYLNAKGYVVIHAKDATRQTNIYFTNKK